MSDLRRVTLLGAALGGGAFVAMGLYMNVATGAPPLSNLGPMAVFAVIGATVGGLVAPLFRRSDDGESGDA